MEIFDKKISKSKILEGGFILINKPLNWSSFQVVNKVRFVREVLSSLGSEETSDSLRSFSTFKSTRLYFSLVFISRNCRVGSQHWNSEK